MLYFTKKSVFCLVEEVWLGRCYSISPSSSSKSMASNWNPSFGRSFSKESRYYWGLIWLIASTWSSESSNSYSYCSSYTLKSLSQSENSLQRIDSWLTSSSSKLFWMLPLAWLKFKWFSYSLIIFSKHSLVCWSPINVAPVGFFISWITILRNILLFWSYFWRSLEFFWYLTLSGSSWLLIFDSLLTCEFGNGSFAFDILTSFTQGWTFYSSWSDHIYN